MLVDINSTVRRAIPDELGQYVDLRRLTASQMEEASTEAALKSIRQFGEDFKTITAIAREARSERQEDTPKEINYKQYDARVLFKYAVASWSYDEEVSESSLERLDAATYEWLWEEVVKMNVRPPVKSNA